MSYTDRNSFCKIILLIGCLYVYVVQSHLMLPRFFILWWFIFTCSTGLADERDSMVQLQEGGRYDLVSYVKFLEDKTGKLTIQQLSSPEMNRLMESPEGVLNFGITPYTYWLKINLVGSKTLEEGSVTTDWYLEIGRVLLDVAELYVSNVNGDFEVYSADTRMPFSERQIYHVNSVFPVSVFPGKKQTFYLKIKHPRSPLYLPIVLWKPEAFVQKVAVEEFLYGLFYGSVLVLVFYNVFIYFTVRERSYIYYVGYLLMIMAYQLLQSGHGVLHILPLYDVGTVNALASILWGVYIFVLLFMQSFLDVKKYHPRINSFLNVLLLFFVLNIPLTQYFSGTVAVQFAGFSPLFLTPIVVGVGFYSWQKGNANGKFYFFSWLPVIVGAVFNSFVLTGVLTSMIRMAEFVTPVSIICEAVILSFALANRIKLSQDFVLSSSIEREKNLQKYRSIFENSLQGLYRMTMEGRIVSANLAFIKIFGESKAARELDGGERVAKLMFSDVVSDYNVMRSGNAIESSVVVPMENEDELFVTHSAKIVFDCSGFPSHIEGGIVDDTEPYRRLKAISEREKERVKKEFAQRLMESTNKYLSMMSHHIRIPLTAIIGYGELLKDDGYGVSQRREWIKIVDHNSHSLLKLINDILDYSKIDAGKMDIENIGVDVGEIVSSINSVFSKKATDLGLAFDVRYQLPMPRKIVGDPTRIVQVLNNLCENAIKFTCEGEVILSLYWDDNIEKIKFSVVDTGAGISRVKQRSLFDIFSHCDEKYSGVGLGLVLSKKLALLMGGDITVESKVGKGSVFTLVTGNGLPVDVGWMNKKLLDKKQNKVKEGKVSLARPLKGVVLLAEDNVVNQKLIERVLKKTGVTVVVVDDGLDACDYCDKTLPDFVLMDLNMPNRGGVEATEYLRGRGYDMPIYALTAETDREEIDRILKAGCQGFLKKPLNREALNKVLSEYLGS